MAIPAATVATVFNGDGDEWPEGAATCAFGALADHIDEIDFVLGFALGQEVLPHERLGRLRKLIAREGAL